MRKLRSLRVRLLLMFMLVVMVALATSAFVQNQSTANAFQAYTYNVGRYYNNKQNEQVVTIDTGRIDEDIKALFITYNAHQAKEVQAIVDKAAQDNGLRIILIDHSKRVVIDSSGQL